MQGLHMADHHERTGAQGAAAVFHAHSVSKIYRMGEVEVQAQAQQEDKARPILRLTTAFGHASHPSVD